MGYPITTQKGVRNVFWETFGHELPRRKINGDYHVDTRCAFVDFVDHLARDGAISNALAARVTL